MEAAVQYACGAVRSEQAGGTGEWEPVSKPRPEAVREQAKTSLRDESAAGEMVWGDKSREAAEMCLRDETLRRFWTEVIRAVGTDSRGDVDGEVFSSRDLGVWLGPWDVEVRHDYAWIPQKGGDSYMGFLEEYAELRERFEVVAVWDEDRKLPKLAERLNEFYRRKYQYQFNQ